MKCVMSRRTTHNSSGVMRERSVTERNEGFAFWNFALTVAILRNVA